MPTTKGSYKKLDKILKIPVRAVDEFSTLGHRLFRRTGVNSRFKGRFSAGDY